MDKSREEENNNRYQSIIDNGRLPDHNFVFNPNSNIISTNPFNTNLIIHFYYLIFTIIHLWILLYIIIQTLMLIILIK